MRRGPYGAANYQRSGSGKVGATGCIFEPMSAISQARIRGEARRIERKPRSWGDMERRNAPGITLPRLGFIDCPAAAWVDQPIR